MCGIAAAVRGPEAGIAGDPLRAVEAMTAAQAHRGPDADGCWLDPEAGVALGHARLAIRDLSDAGVQPMFGGETGAREGSRGFRSRWGQGRWVLSFNGEILNDAELRAELGGESAFETGTDTEVLLAAWDRWGLGCLERLVGFFAFVLWDRRERTLWAVRDRFGVKPLFVHRHGDGGLLLASEIGALFAAGAERRPSAGAWSAYLAAGVHDEGRATFWDGVERLEAGCLLRWRGGQVTVRRWYDLPSRIGFDVEGHEPFETDTRSDDEVTEEVRARLEESVALRFRSDVPVGINLSGGLDSSTLLALVHAVQGEDSEVAAYTFYCGDPDYDELPWVEEMLERTRHPLVRCRLAPDDVPELAASVWRHQLEPYGGVPTLAYARLFEEARARGTTVLLDGQGMDEQWAGYDYYARALEPPTGSDQPAPTVQGTSAPLRPGCLATPIRVLAEQARSERARLPSAGDDPDARLVALQLRDLLHTKLPRALRFNDRVSMRASCELREPFLDHRLVELALRQPARRKIAPNEIATHGTRKETVRRIARELLPSAVVEAPKRPVQTPQREWLREPLREWAEETMAAGRRAFPDWLDEESVAREWRRFLAGEADNGFFVWQWVSLGLASGADASGGDGGSG